MKDVVQLMRLEKGGRNWGPKTVSKKTKVKPAVRATVNTRDPIVAKLVLEESADRSLGTDLSSDPVFFAGLAFDEISFVPPELTVAHQVEFPDELLIPSPPDLVPAKEEEIFIEEEAPKAKKPKRRKEEDDSNPTIELDLKAEDTPLEVR